MSYSIKYWWLLSLIGVLFIIGGVFMLAKPFASIAAMTILFSVSFFVWGIFEIVFSLYNTRNQNWGWYLAGGVLDLLIGIMLMSSSLFEQMEILAFFIGFWLIFRGAVLMGHSFEFKHLGVKNWGWLLFLAIVTLLLAFAVIAIPALALGTVLIWVSISLIFLGISYIVLGFSSKGK
ncbi:MAG: DUF308 domain-containing protein [Fibrobacter sp.]|jgi:uncharacterized membrane protein HdeD (DUF308 family)|nr:DUF308 domain-containing protein [Fibrobacter sp.]